MRVAGPLLTNREFGLMQLQGAASPASPCHLAPVKATKPRILTTVTVTIRFETSPLVQLYLPTATLFELKKLSRVLPRDSNGCA